MLISSSSQGLGTLTSQQFMGKHIHVHETQVTKPESLLPV
jgi:hypothetical protein